MEAHAFRGRFDIGHPRPGLNADAAPGQALAHQPADLGVLAGQYPRQRLDEDHLFSAKDTVQVGELDAARTGTDDAEAARHLGQRQGTGGGEDGLLVKWDTGERPRHRAGGEDHVARPEPHLLAVRWLNGHLAQGIDAAHRPLDAHRRTGNAADAGHDLDLVLLQQTGDAPAQRLDHSVFAGHGCGEIERYVTYCDPVLAGLTHGGQYFSVTQQGLGRDAAHIEADPAQLTLFHDGRPQP